MKLHPVKHDYRAKLWCGIAALATITGRPTSECRAAIVAARGRNYDGSPQRVMGILNSELSHAFTLMGFNLTRIAYHGGQTMKQRPTLAQYLRTRGEHANEPVVVNVTGHYVTVKGRSFIDNSSACADGPIPLKDGRCRRSRVFAAWVVRKSTIAAAWAAPASKKRVANTARNKTRALAAAHPEITLDVSDWRSMAQIWVYCSKLEATGEDPFTDEGHMVDDWDEALERVETYVKVLAS